MLVEGAGELREAITRFLMGHGFRVVAAAHSHDALAVLREYQGPVDVIVTDYNTPRISGTPLAVWLRRLLPKVPVVVIAATVSGERKPSEVLLLNDPARLDELLARIRAALIRLKHRPRSQPGMQAKITL